MSTTNDKFGCEDFSAPPDRMPRLIARFQSDRDCLGRLLPPLTCSWRSNRLAEFFDDWRGTLDSLPFDDLTRSDRVDWLLLSSLIQAEERRLKSETEAFESLVTTLLTFAEPLIALEASRRKRETVSGPLAAEVLDDACRKLADTRTAIAAATAAATPADAIQAARLASRIRVMTEEWFGFYVGFDPLFTWWVEKPYRALDAALGEYGTFLRETVAGAMGDAVVGNPIGRPALCDELLYAQVAYTPEELIDAARAEMDWSERELRAAAREMGHGDNWRLALEQVKSSHVAPGDQPALVRDLAEEAIAYVEAHDLVTVPPLARECWRIEMMAAERQKVNPFFLGGEVIIVSFPTSEMEHPQKRMSLRGNNPAFARATVHHELIPGHHLQMFSQERYRPYRRVFRTPFWIEGWTLHWEMLLWEREFARTPAERIGMLFWRRHRAARVIFSLRFHLGEMTANECVEYLTHEVGHERDNATAEVRRSFEGSYNALYQAAYLIGAWQMHALYRELAGSGTMTDREFHDAVLHENIMPIPMLRALLTKASLGRKFANDWRFLGTSAINA